MTVEEDKTLSNELRGRFDSPCSAVDKQTIERLYLEVLAKPFKPTTCQQCYHDGLIEIICYLNKHNAMKEKSNYTLRAGFIIQCPDFMGGKVFTNANLTDEVAAAYLERFPNKAVFFASIPKKNDAAITTPAKTKRGRRTKKMDK